MWCRCDSKTKYLFEFDLYNGKKHGGVKCGLREAVLLSRTEKLEGLQCQVYFDNYFNSSQLQVTFCLKKIFSAETVHINRKMFPNKN